MMAAPNAPDWLTARPIAHRGFHDKANGRIENSIAAAKAAIAHHYAIECDLQISKDGEAIVFHDFTLDRLTVGQGALCGLEAETIAAAAYKEGSGAPPRFADFLTTIASRTPLIVEIKSRFDGDTRLAARAAAISATYPGPLALKSFDPQMLLALRQTGVACPLGFIGEAHYDHPEWDGLSADTKAVLKNFAFYADVRPDFLSWCAGDLPHPAPGLCRAAIGMPVMTWTIRSPEAAASVMPYTDQIIFEGFAA